MARNIEARLIEHLHACGQKRKPKYIACADMPQKTNAARIVTLERVGGSFDGINAEQADILIQCYAPTRFETSELAADVLQDACALIERPGITAVRITSGIKNFPDYEANKERYQFLIEITNNTLTD